MQHGDSGPTPSAGNNSAAVAGAPVVSNTKPIVQPAAAKKAPVQPNNKEAAVTALTATAKDEAPAAQAVPAPPVATTNGSTATSAAEPVKVSPPAPPVAVSAQKPLEVQKPVENKASAASEHDDAPGGFFCCGSKPRKQTNDSKQYDRV